MRAAILIALVPALAHADPELGTPLPGPTAYPAMAGLSPYVMDVGVDYVPALPAVDLGGGVTAPRRSPTYLAFQTSSFVSGTQLGWFGYYSIGGGMGLHVGGDVGEPFMANGAAYTDGGTTQFSITPLAPGFGYRRVGWLVGAQLVPRVEWYTEAFTRGATTASGRDHDYVLRADVQACVAYNLGHVFPKNSAACVYVQPVIYREGWLAGASLGLRLFAL